MNDQSKSLLTIKNAYDWDYVTKIDGDHLSYDLSHHNLSIEDQIKLYKKIITETDDIKDVYFFLSGICNLEQIHLDYHIIKQLSIEILTEQKEKYSFGELSELIGCSKYTLYNILQNSTITEDMAIRIIFTFNKQLLKEIIS